VKKRKEKKRENGTHDGFVPEGNDLEPGGPLKLAVGLLQEVTRINHGQVGLKQ